MMTIDYDHEYQENGKDFLSKKLKSKFWSKLKIICLQYQWFLALKLHCNCIPKWNFLLIRVINCQMNLDGGWRDFTRINILIRIHHMTVRTMVTSWHFSFCSSLCFFLLCWIETVRHSQTADVETRQPSRKILWLVETWASRNGDTIHHLYFCIQNENKPFILLPARARAKWQKLRRGLFLFLFYLFLLIQHQTRLNKNKKEKHRTRIYQTKKKKERSLNSSSWFVEEQIAKQAKSSR